MKTKIKMMVACAGLVLAAGCSGPGGDSNVVKVADHDNTSAVVAVGDPNPLRDAFFGETHMHTAYSLDAYIGGARLLPSDAYRYAKGEAVEVGGERLQRRRPLDFVAVTDHAEYIGEMYSTMVAGAPGHDNELLDELRGLEKLEDKQQWFTEYVVSANRSTTPQHPPFFAGPETVKSAWQVTIDAAEEHNDPGRFTAFIAFEWSGAPNGGNLHRNVIFRDAHVPEAPVSYIDINREDGLWEWMAGNEAQGMMALAIPHNSNASKGMMFPDVDAAGSPIALEYAEKRQHFEPLIEMMQVKGNSEVHRKFWAADEFADFENADSIQKYSDRTFNKHDFVREGLKKGLAFEQSLGANPFKLGFIGGTDNHNGLPSAVEEDAFIGAHGPEDGSVERRRDAGVANWIDGRDLSIGSLAGVWAVENTRAAIWDAMNRRETFATSGPRIKVRFFGGVELPGDPDDPQTLVEQGYELGVPMGSDLPAIGAAPNFTVHAMKDPDGANLDRVQIIKGWVDADGELHETIVDVAWSGDRVRSADGKLPAVGNSVDLTTALYTNSIGAAQLVGSWRDDAFDPEQHAFYYVRVLEIPTPRWSTYDAVKHNLPLLEDVPATIQERAWTSPIWYRP
ncbi:MAG: DUF3604 domain-containing protein [Thermoanaerobaculales bacterium]|jgi:hypothetical protein|nr:DUF3604 domain-containing protein [Thermoanaerobaculales bacterium]